MDTWTRHNRLSVSSTSSTETDTDTPSSTATSTISTANGSVFFPPPSYPSPSSHHSPLPSPIPTIDGIPNDEEVTTENPLAILTPTLPRAPRHKLHNSHPPPTRQDSKIAIFGNLFGGKVEAELTLTKTTQSLHLEDLGDEGEPKEIEEKED